MVFGTDFLLELSYLCSLEALRFARVDFTDVSRPLLQKQARNDLKPGEGSQWGKIKAQH